tara:strand:+ start:174 stop:512 length:339 start_codon:yes stop_codon:yes gene_type:complete
MGSNETLLIFIDAADDAAAYPLSRFRGMTVAADATIKMQFEASIGDPDGSNVNTDLVTVTCTADTELTVFKSLAAAIYGKTARTQGYVVVADDVNSTYVDSNISGIDITLDT